MLATFSLIAAFAVYYILCFKWDWFLEHWPLMTVRQHLHDVEMTILLCEAYHVNDDTYIDLEWPLDPDLADARRARIVQAKRDAQWDELMAAVSA